MSSVDDPRASLLAAARGARNVCAYLATFPGDSSALQPLRQAASQIADASGRIKNRALSELSSQFTRATGSAVLTEKRVRKLHRILTQILLMAELMAVEDPMSTKRPDGSIQGPRDPILPEVLPRWKLP